MQQILEFDYQILRIICESIRNDFLDPIFLFITHLGDGGIIWILIAAVCLFKKNTRFIGISMLISLLAGLIVGNVFMKNIVARPRPFQTYSDIVNLINQGGYSFPSGHSLSSFTAAMSFYLCAKYKKKIMPEKYNTLYIWGIVLLVLAALIALSRLYVCVHYPTDVICGSIIGIIISLIVFKIIKKQIEI